MCMLFSKRQIFWINCWLSPDPTWPVVHANPRTLTLGFGIVQMLVFGFVSLPDSPS